MLTQPRLKKTEKYLSIFEKERSSSKSKRRHREGLGASDLESIEQDDIAGDDGGECREGCHTSAETEAKRNLKEIG